MRGGREGATNLSPTFLLKRLMLTLISTHILISYFPTAKSLALKVAIVFTNDGVPAISPRLSPFPNNLLLLSTSVSSFTPVLDHQLTVVTTHPHLHFVANKPKSKFQILRFLQRLQDGVLTSHDSLKVGFRGSDRDKLTKI